MRGHHDRETRGGRFVLAWAPVCTVAVHSRQSRHTPWHLPAVAGSRGGRVRVPRTDRVLAVALRMDIITLLVVGLVAGVIAATLVGPGFGLLGDIVLGIAGSFMGG